MSELKKTMDAIVNCISTPKCRDCPWEECEQDHQRVDGVPYGLMQSALSLLNKQEPKAVIDICSVGGHLMGKCPECHRVLRAQDYTSFCGFCGQALLWKWS